MEILFLVSPTVFLAEQMKDPCRSCGDKDQIFPLSSHPHLRSGVVYQQQMSDRVLVLLVLVVLHSVSLHHHLPPVLPAPVHLGGGEGGDGADKLQGGVVVGGLLAVGMPGCDQGLV